jgi:nucleoside-diphosphate-sugar epimerase
MPTGGTSDYGPEMIHHAAGGTPYECFVRPDTRLPFMAMPDAVKSLVDLWAAPKDSLKQLVYNVTSFSPSAQEFKDEVLKAFPEAQITFKPHESRQKIVDSWPADICDEAACRDWGWKPDYDMKRAFEEYLIPGIKQHYYEA